MLLSPRFSKNQHNTFQIKFNPLLFGRGERVHALVEFDVVRAFPVPRPRDGAIFRSVSPYRSRESKRYLTLELQVHFFFPTLTPEAICSWNRLVMLCTYLCFKLKHNRDFRWCWRWQHCLLLLLLLLANPITLFRRKWLLPGTELAREIGSPLPLLSEWASNRE